MTAAIHRSAVNKDIYWLPSGDQHLATMLHYPASGEIRSAGFIICPPLGHEHVHTFRSFRVLADSLATAGFAVARFEYRGTGNSTGPGVFDQQVNAWIADIRCQISALEAMPGITHICLVGFRISTLLARAAIEGLTQASLIEWAPCKSAKFYARELKALSRMSGYPQLLPDAIECGGFVYSNDLLDDLRKMDSDGGPMTQPERLLVINLGDNESSAETVYQTPAEYDEMLLEPHYSQIPETTISHIVTWCNESFDSQTRFVNPVDNELQQYSATEYSESLVWDADRSLAGVYCRANDAGRKNTILLIANAGSVHSMGPNRIYAELARNLASHGVDTFRFDLPNLGESVVGLAESDNEPYVDIAFDSIQSTIEYSMKRWGFRTANIAGLCSGAYNTLMTAVQAEPDVIERVIVINPLTFFWEPGLPYRLGSGQGKEVQDSYYSHASRSSKSWIRLLTGKANYRAIFGYALRRCLKIVRSISYSIGDRIGLTGPTNLGQQLLTVDSNNTLLHFIFSTRDPGLELLRRESRLTGTNLISAGKLIIDAVEDADHTFSQHQHRARFLETISNIFERDREANGHD
ncbi:MAG: hypothetical protein AAF351_10075 [Pseudomonadota bacterium]